MNDNDNACNRYRYKLRGIMMLCSNQPRFALASLFVLLIVVNFFLYKNSTFVTRFLPLQPSAPAPSSVHPDNKTTLSTQQDPGSSSSNTKTPQNATKDSNNDHLSNILRHLKEFPPLRGETDLPEDFKRLLKQKEVNPHDFKIIVKPNVDCANRVIEVAICVPISRKNFRGRQVIRDTWGSYANKSSNNAILVFFIGSGAEYESPDVTGQDIQKQILNESKQFGDILQESYIDSYNNLSLKSMSILKWTSMHCYGAKYVLKADDDMYVNIPYMINLLRKSATQSSTPSAFVMGSKQVGARPQRTKTSKWYTPLTAYKDDRFPNYVSGTTYVMTNVAAVMLFEASLRTPLFWLEDIYITGICAQKANVAVWNNDAFTYEKPRASGCVFRTRVSGHRYNLEEIANIHKELYDPNLKCKR